MYEGALFGRSSNAKIQCWKIHLNYWSTKCSDPRFRTMVEMWGWSNELWSVDKNGSESMLRELGSFNFFHKKWASTIFCLFPLPLEASTVVQKLLLPIEQLPNLYLITMGIFFHGLKTVWSLRSPMFKICTIIFKCVAIIYELGQINFSWSYACHYIFIIRN